VRNAYKILIENPQEKIPLGRHGRTHAWDIKLRRVTGRQDGQLTSSGSACVPLMGFCDHSNEISGFLRARSLLTS
jgi:hypothetical protein